MVRPRLPDLSGGPYGSPFFSDRGEETRSDQNVLMTIPGAATGRRSAGIVKLVRHAKPADAAHGRPALLNSEKAAVGGTTSHPPILGAPSRIVTGQRMGWRLHQHYWCNKERGHRRETHCESS